MALRTIKTNDKHLDDVPWSNEYLDKYPEAEDEAFLVRKLVLVSKGFMVVTDDFKAFLFKDSSIFEFLKEALEYWVKNSTHNLPLYSTLASSGKISLAIDDEEEATIWLETKKNKIWEQKRKKGPQDGSEGTPSNPFIINPPPTTKPKKGTTTSRIQSDAETSH